MINADKTTHIQKMAEEGEVRPDHFLTEEQAAARKTSPNYCVFREFFRYLLRTYVGQYLYLQTPPATEAMQVLASSLALSVIERFNREWALFMVSDYDLEALAKRTPELLAQLTKRVDNRDFVLTFADPNKVYGHNFDVEPRYRFPQFKAYVSEKVQKWNSEYVNAKKSSRPPLDTLESYEIDKLYAFLFRPLSVSDGDALVKRWLVQRPARAAAALWQYLIKVGKGEPYNADYVKQQLLPPLGLQCRVDAAVREAKDLTGAVTPNPESLVTAAQLRETMEYCQYRQLMRYMVRSYLAALNVGNIDPKDMFIDKYRSDIILDQFQDVWTEYLGTKISGPNRSVLPYAGFLPSLYARLRSLNERQLKGVVKVLPTANDRPYGLRDGEEYERIKAFVDATLLAQYEYHKQEDKLDVKGRLPDRLFRASDDVYRWPPMEEAVASQEAMRLILASPDNDIKDQLAVIGRSCKQLEIERQDFQAKVAAGDQKAMFANMIKNESVAAGTQIAVQTAELVFYMIWSLLWARRLGMESAPQTPGYGQETILKLDAFYREVMLQTPQTEPDDLRLQALYREAASALLEPGDRYPTFESDYTGQYSAGIKKTSVSATPLAAVSVNAELNKFLDDHPNQIHAYSRNSYQWPIDSQDKALSRRMAQILAATAEERVPTPPPTPPPLSPEPEPPLQLLQDEQRLFTKAKLRYIALSYLTQDISRATNVLADVRQFFINSRNMVSQDAIDKFLNRYLHDMSKTNKLPDWSTRDGTYQGEVTPERMKLISDRIKQFNNERDQDSTVGYNVFPPSTPELWWPSPALAEEMSIFLQTLFVGTTQEAYRGATKRLYAAIQSNMKREVEAGEDVEVEDLTKGLDELDVTEDDVEEESSDVGGSVDVDVGDSSDSSGGVDVGVVGGDSDLDVGGSSDIGGDVDVGDGGGVDEGGDDGGNTNDDVDPDLEDMVYLTAMATYPGINVRQAKDLVQIIGTKTLNPATLVDEAYGDVNALGTLSRGAIDFTQYRPALLGLGQTQIGYMVKAIQNIVAGQGRPRPDDSDVRQFLLVGNWPTAELGEKLDKLGNGENLELLQKTAIQWHLNFTSGQRYYFVTPEIVEQNEAELKKAADAAKAKKEEEEATGDGAAARIQLRPDATETTATAAAADTTTTTTKAGLLTLGALGGMGAYAKWGFVGVVMLVVFVLLLVLVVYLLYKTQQYQDQAKTCTGGSVPTTTGTTISS